MPIYEHRCRIHGLFQVLRPIIGGEVLESCPLCGSQCVRAISAPAPAVVKTRDRLPYGSGSRGKFIPAEETGGMSIFVPSFGALEREEVEYTAEAAAEKERERVAKSKPLNEENAMTKEALGNVVKIGKNQPEGQRAKTMEKVKREGLV